VRAMTWPATLRRPGRRTSAVVRSADEPHRAATSLELFYDLCFVVAVSQASSELHHLIVERRFADGIIGFGAAFFGIWWAWVNFVWFASGHDSDDVPFRLLTLVQIAGVLILAAGIHDAMIQFDFTTMTIGYVVMRLGLVGMWLRVARDQPSHRRRALRFVAGITAVQVLWLLRLTLPDDRALLIASFVTLALVELTIPIWAERAAPGQQFHARHLAERYGLFTILVLGEVILSSTVAVREAIDAVGIDLEVLVVAAAALVIAFAVWWSYFGRDDEPEVDRLHGAFLWGYGHLPVFAGLAAFGAGVHVAVDAAAGSPEVTDRVAALAVTVPLAVAISGFTISVANARSSRERRLLPVEAAKFTVVLLLGLTAPIYVAIIGTAVLFVAGTILQGIVLERRLGVEVATQ
jgi:low temperature requirement protein LtrA